jgi:hypothetical protein
MNLEYTALFLSRFVCGIVLNSMEKLEEQCKQIGGNALQSSVVAGLAVREYIL